MILHDKAVGAQFLDEFRVEPLKHRPFEKGIIGELQSRCLIQGVERLQNVVVLVSTMVKEYLVFSLSKLNKNLASSRNRRMQLHTVLVH